MKPLLIILLAALPLAAFGQDSTATDYYNKGMELLDSRQAHLAVACFEKSDSLDKIQLPKTSPDYYRSELALAKCWDDLANYFHGIKDADETIKLQTRVVNTRKKILGASHPDYISAKNKLKIYRLSFKPNKSVKTTFKQGMMLLAEKKHEDALPYLQECDSIYKAKYKPTSPKYYKAELPLDDCLDVVASIAYYNGDYDKSLRLQKQILESRKKILGDKHPDYAYSLNNLGLINSHLTSRDEAIKLNIAAVEIFQKYAKEDSYKYAEALNNLSFSYMDLGNYDKAISYGTAAVQMFERVLEQPTPDYAAAYEQLAHYNYKLGNYIEAIRLQNIAVNLWKTVLGERHTQYTNSLGRLAGFNSNIGNYDEARRLYTMALKIITNSLDKHYSDSASTWPNIASCHSALGNYDEAIRYATLASENVKKVLGERHPKYANTLQTLADLYFFHKDNKAEGIRLQTMAIDIIKNAYGENSLSYATLIEQLAIFNYYSDNYDEAIRLEKITLDIRKRKLGEENAEYAYSLSCNAVFRPEAGKYDDATKYYFNEYTERTKSFILKNFTSMTYMERSNYWNTNSFFFNKQLPLAAYKINDSNINAAAYNGQVFSKGLLLNAELEMQKIIEQSGDTTFASRYYKIKQSRAILDGLYQISLDKRTIDADSLAKAIDNEEHQLVASCKELGDYTHNLSIDWREIQKNLHDNDLAIEFATVKDPDAKQLIYIALALKKGMSAPALVKLYELDDFYDIKTGEYYRTPKLYNLIWKPLEQYLDGVKNVFFSPAGQFHTIGVEYLPDEDGNIFAEKYNAYRLSSTRELALEHTTNPRKKAATYGGIKYDFSKDDWQNIKKEIDSVWSFHDAPQLAENYRGGVMVDLLGTKYESAEVAALLRAAQYDVSALTDAAATEESFKKLSGTGLKILHTGTHGFYETDSDMENSRLKFYSAAKQSEEDRSLSCSGLLFAGANSALDPKRNKEIPQGADDGILTAKEISRLDFKGLDLVVLSACQTGLGEITSEGVFGLQRGFKKAGAQTIVMSLWKVADESTQLLMVEFFKNLTAGQSKRAAFIAALQTVRAKYPNPLYWAAFVMVDGY